MENAFVALPQGRSELVAFRGVRAVDGGGRLGEETLGVKDGGLGNGVEGCFQ